MQSGAREVLLFFRGEILLVRIKVHYSQSEGSLVRLRLKTPACVPVQLGSLNRHIIDASFCSETDCVSLGFRP